MERREFVKFSSMLPFFGVPVSVADGLENVAKSPIQTEYEGDMEFAVNEIKEHLNKYINWITFSYKDNGSKIKGFFYDLPVCSCWVPSKLNVYNFIDHFNNKLVGGKSVVQDCWVFVTPELRNPPYYGKPYYRYWSDSSEV